MKKSFYRFSLILVVFSLLFFNLIQAESIKTCKIIPYPQQIIQQDGIFKIDRKTIVVCPSDRPDIQKIVTQFVDQFKTVSGFRLQVVQYPASVDSKIIEFVMSDKLGPEAYKLKINSKSVQITSGTSNGFFYALQTIYQLLPAGIYGKTLSKVKKWELPCVEIADAPRFSYRGLHLDVCRHFFPVSFVKKYIDAMAIHKLNRFHWHLTDDQGWRIEIKKFPKLTQVGSMREKTLVGHYYENYPQQFDDTAYGGFYTQDEAREIVAYAAERFITVIPEIEMPGHAMAAIASYPYLSCTREKIKVAPKWGIFEDVFCPRDSTFAFLEDVLTEVMDIFPSEYIHIGGDECPKTRWETCPDCQGKIKTLGLKDEHELQSYFIQRIEKFVNSKGRKIIGWDEILEGGLAPNATVMSWRGTKGGIAAAQSGHDVVMTPGEYCYFDHYQAYPVGEPTAIGGFTSLKKVYGYEPVPVELNKEQAKHVLGAQANVWTEYLPTETSVEYMVFPRISAMAEVLWTNPDNKDWERFRQNIPKEFERYNVLDIKPSKVFYDINSTVKISPDNKPEVSLETDNPNAIIRYTFDKRLPRSTSAVYRNAIVLNSNAIINTRAFEKNKKSGKAFSLKVEVSKVTGMKYNASNLNNWYKGGNEFALTDGIFGNTKTANEWVGFSGSNDHEVVFDFDKQADIQSVVFRMLNVPSLRGVFSPEITVYTSTNGENFEAIASESVNKTNNTGWEICENEINFEKTTTRFLKILFKNPSSFNDAKGQKGNSNLFVDEILIR